MHLGGLLSTQEAEVAQSVHDSSASFVLYSFRVHLELGDGCMLQVYY